VKGIAVSILGIASIDGKARPQPIASLIHVDDALDNVPSRETPTGDIHNADQSAGVKDFVVAIGVLEVLPVHLPLLLYHDPIAYHKVLAVFPRQ
jgi:hypothetical protein